MKKKQITLQTLFSNKKIERRHLRNHLFRIRNNDRDLDVELKEIIEKQFVEGLNWSNFTFEWDIGVNDPFKVVSKKDWVKSGGAFDDMGKRFPTAFTQQK
jgi:hypothetical protein